MTASPENHVVHVIEIAADVFGVPAATLTAESSAESVEAWDSISHLNLMLAVEQATGTTISPEQMVELTSIGRIADAVANLQSR